MAWPGRARARHFCSFLKGPDPRPEAQRAFACSGQALAQKLGPMAGPGRDQAHVFWLGLGSARHEVWPGIPTAEGERRFWAEPTSMLDRRLIPSSSPPSSASTPSFKVASLAAGDNANNASPQPPQACPGGKTGPPWRGSRRSERTSWHGDGPRRRRGVGQRVWAALY